MLTRPEGVKAVFGQVLEEDMTVHLGVSYEGTEICRGKRNG